jgi:hypothetical protein
VCLDLKAGFPLDGICAQSGIFLCLVIFRVKQIRKDKEKFRLVENLLKILYNRKLEISIYKNPSNSKHFTNLFVVA